MPYLFLPNSNEGVNATVSRRIKGEYQYACALPFCRSPFDLEIHHIVPKKEAFVGFGDADFLPNLILLCAQHHAEAGSNKITTAYLAELASDWATGVALSRVREYRDRYVKLEREFDKHKAFTIENLAQSHERTLYVNSTSLADHVMAFRANQAIISSVSDPETRFEFWLSLASTWRRHSTQTRSDRMAKRRLRAAQRHLSECRDLLEGCDLSHAFRDRLDYESAYVAFLHGTAVQDDLLSRYVETPTSFGSVVNKCLLLTFGADNPLDRACQMESALEILKDKDETRNNRWVFNATSHLVDLRVAGGQLRDSDMNLIDWCIKYTNDEHYYSSKPELFMTKGVFLTRTGNAEDGVRNLELALAIAKQYNRFERIAEIHRNLGLGYRALGHADLATEQFRLGASVAATGSNLRFSQECARELVRQKGH